MNALIVDQFNKLIKKIKANYLNAQLKNDIKEIDRQYYILKQTKRILNTLQSLDFQINSENDLKGIPGIGKGTLTRIKEILETGKLAEAAAKFEKDEELRIYGIKQLLKVIGVGDKLARKLVVEYGITNVDELKNAVTSGKIRVSPLVKIGLKYYGIVQKKIPRDEIKEVEKYLVKKATDVDPELHVMICGSYRRGMSYSGDIDVMIYHPDVKYVRQIYKLEDYGKIAFQGKQLSPPTGGFKSFLELFVDLLTKDGYLLDRMTISKMKYMGFCKAWEIFSQSSESVSKPVRRIDILFMPYNSLPAAMLYFTGPGLLNEEMRIRAKKRNMTLNEYGLFILDSHGNYLPVPVHSEKDIFEEIGIKYLTPAERQGYA